MAKLFKKLFMLFMVITFILSAFGCDEDITKGKEVITEETANVYGVYNENIVFKNFKALEDFTNSDVYFKNNYYAIINTESLYVKPLSTPREPPEYTFQYNKKTGNEYIENQIRVYAVLTDKNAPKKRNGCNWAAKDGRSEWTCWYIYCAYPTTEINTPLSFKHVVTKRDIFDVISYRATIQIFQDEKLIGLFYYCPDKHDDEYYENFLKENLIIIGGNDV